MPATVETFVNKYCLAQTKLLLYTSDALINVMFLAPDMLATYLCIFIAIGVKFNCQIPVTFSACTVTKRYCAIFLAKHKITQGI